MKDKKNTYWATEAMQEIIDYHNVEVKHIFLHTRH